ncbi:MAG: patatin-like phospholipase family protein [Bacteroidales bacterium]|nr:patatin-like phospholipase family protein [Bacteroidales bacterium]
MAYHFRNLVFEGGGVKGIAYVGALEVLDEKGILKDIQRVAGTSVGAMIAVMVGLRYTAEEMRQVLWDLKFKKFLDKSFGVANITRLISEYGWYKGDYFRNLMVDLIKAKTGNGEITFKGLAETNKFMDIHLVGADLSTGTSLTFNARNTPNVSIAEAARISMSIPVFFASVTGAKGDDNRKDHVFVDGGLLDNYSIKTFDKYSYVFDKEKNARRTEYYDKFNRKKSVLKDLDGDVYVYNKETLGFRLDAKEDISMYRTHTPAIRNKITSFFTYTKALVTTLIDFQNNVHLHSDDWQRTIYIDTLGVRAIDFGIEDNKKDDLLASGRQYTLDYLKWYDNDEEKANK